MRFLRILMILILSIGIVSILNAQRQTGSIKGTVTDPEGNPLPGVTITVSGPSLIGTITYVTTEDGVFRAPALPPGTYTITAELTGFQTVKREEVIVHVGMTTEVKIELKPAPIAETITVTAASPVVDVESSKVSVTVAPEVLKNIPIARDLYDVITTAPGVISEGVAYRRTFSAHGSTVRGNTYAFDGVNMNDPVVMYPLTNINYDVIQETEIVLGGHPAEIGYTEGAYINVVTKSGGNNFSGSATFYYSSKDTTKVVFPDTQLKAMGVSAPEYATSDMDASGSLGGPIMKDKLWFFANARYLNNTFTSPFRPTTILGKYYGPFDLDHTEVMSFVKLTTQITPSIRFMGLFNFTDIYEPYFRLDKAWNITSEAMRVWDHEKGYTGNGVLTWLLDPNTFLDIRAAYVHRWFPLPMQPGEPQNNYYFYDGYTGYRWGNARFNETYLRKRFHTSASITRFQDNLFGLGDNHEIKAGADFEQAYGDWNWWRNNAVIWYYWNGDPYYYVGQLGAPHSTRGHGVIFPYICETEADKGDKPSIQDMANRIGGYIQDSITIKDRLTINAGVRIDYSYGYKPASKKGRSDNFAYVLGETYLKPVYGINPYDEISNPEWKDIIKWTSISPRLGITYDVFGNGKTALKASFARYTQYLMLQYFSVLHPLYPRSFSFGWWDLNGNKKLDLPPVDRYVFYGTTPDVMKFEYSANKLDPNTKSPYTDELIVGIQHELMRDFSVGINYIYKNMTNILEDVLYDIATGQNWYHLDKAPSGWWVPFRTIVPAYDIFPAQEVTVYFPSKNAPGTFWYRFTNVPEGERKYQGLELIFNKRMSQGWMLGGSVTFSKFEGNIGGDYGSSWGWSGAFDNPNWFVNRYGRLDFDRPLVIKLYGTVTLPYRIYLSGYYNHYDGGPWGRTVTIYPPSAWATAKNVNTTLLASVGVYVEKPGTRRGQGVDTLDLRVEKEFDLGKYGRIGVYVDAFNVMGFNRVFITQDVGGTWRPTEEGTDRGTFTPAGTYKQITGVEGTRMFKFSIRYSF